jgi:hypothetical protein
MNRNQIYKEIITGMKFLVGRPFDDLWEYMETEEGE